jgi:hypothetical protein
MVLYSEHVSLCDRGSFPKNQCGLKRHNLDEIYNDP